MPLTANGPEIYIATTTTVLSDSYNFLADTLNHKNSLKLRDNPGGNVSDCCDAILVDVERLESSVAFKTEYIGSIIRIFEKTTDSRLNIWVTHKYKEVMEFVMKLFVCDKEVMQTDDIITYGYLVQ